MINTIIIANMLMLMSYINYIYSVEEGKVNLYSWLKEIKYKIIITSVLLNVLVIYGVLSDYELNIYVLYIALTLITMSIIDVKTSMVSDNNNILVFIVGLLYILSIGNTELLIDNVSAAMIVVGVFTIVRFASTIIFGKEIMGEGDYIPISLFVLLFGVKVGLILLVLAFVLAGPILIYSLIVGGKKELPFIPFITASIVMGFLEEGKVSNELIKIIKSIIMV